jgi:hypothetical protein
MSETSFITSKMLKLEKCVEKINIYKFKKSKDKKTLNKFINFIYWVYKHSFVIFFRTEMYMIIFIIGLLSLKYNHIPFQYWMIFYGICAPINGFLRMFMEYFKQ